MIWDKDQGSGKQEGQTIMEKAMCDWWENHKLMPVIDEPGTIPCGLSENFFLKKSDIDYHNRIILPIFPCTFSDYTEYFKDK